MNMIMKRSSILLLLFSTMLVQSCASVQNNDGATDVIWGNEREGLKCAITSSLSEFQYGKVYTIQMVITNITDRTIILRQQNESIDPRQ